MRKRIWMFCIIVLALCLALLFKTSHRHETALLGLTETTTNLPSQMISQAANSLQNSSSVTSSPIFIHNAVIPPTTVEESNAVDPRLLAHWQAPIDFYGKVIDENSNVVSDVNIHFRWSEKPAEDGMRTADTQSDSKGLFSLNGKRGASLTVWFGKDGYYSSDRGEMSFSYALPRSISPDPQNPVIFHLRKKGIGETLIGGNFPAGMKIAQLHHDGTPVELDLLNGTQVPAGNGQLKLELWRDISDVNKQPFDWKLQLSMLGGGLVPTDEEFAFQAPESGYQPSIVIDMPATNQNWLGEVRTKYYIQLPNGNYGRIDFYLLPYNGVFTVGSSINPSGSRNLEPSQ